MKRIDLTGKISGKLKFICVEGKKWKCVCDCGNIKYHLAKTFGKIKSCGCIRTDINKKNLELAYKKNYKDKYLYLRKMFKKEYSDGNLTFEDFLRLSSQNCYYCNDEPNNLCKTRNKLFGEDIKYNGLDRVNNNIGHMLNNVVPCCKQCNIMKSIYSVDDFKNWICKIINYDRKLIYGKIKIKKIDKIWRCSYNKELDFEDFCFLSQQNCYYCGIEPSNCSKGVNYNGLDRIYAGNHEINNVVPCCKRCNFSKNIMNKDEFFNKINILYCRINLINIQGSY